MRGVKKTTCNIAASCRRILYAIHVRLRVLANDTIERAYSPAIKYSSQSVGQEHPDPSRPVLPLCINYQPILDFIAIVISYYARINPVYIRHTTSRPRYIAYRLLPLSDCRTRTISAKDVTKVSQTTNLLLQKDARALTVHRPSKY